MRGYELDVGSELLLDIIDDTALYARNVGEHDRGLEILLIFLYPLKEHPGIEAEDDRVGRRYDVADDRGIALVYDIVPEGEIYRRAAGIYR